MRSFNPSNDSDFLGLNSIFEVGVVPRSFSWSFGSRVGHDHNRLLGRVFRSAGNRIFVFDSSGVYSVALGIELFAMPSLAYSISRKFYVSS